jgi:hypothetical protein
MTTPGILFSDNEDYNKLLTDKQLQIQDPQIREFKDLKFKKIGSDYYKYLLQSNAYYNFNKETLYHLPSSNYNGNTLEQNHMLEQAFSLQEEIPLNLMKAILDLIKFNYATYKISAPSTVKYVVDNNKIDTSVIAFHLLFQINKRLLIIKESSDKHPFKFYKLDKLVSIENEKGSGKSINMIRISRNNKVYNFTIEFAVSYNVSGSSIIVKYDYITLKGINSDYEFDKYKKDAISQKHSTLDNEFNPDLDYDKELESVNNIIRENRKAYSKDPLFHKKFYDNVMLYPNNGCFILDKDNTIKKLETENPIKCRSYWKEYGYNGVWDTKCKVNTDCPFYSPDEKRGGCDDKSGICDMPVGVTRIGYRKYLKTTEPKCDNCPVDNQYCCSTQSKPNYKFI